jgi:hypothetical protein
MPGICFAEGRARITMAEVLGLVGFVPRETSGDQVRGPCPVHHSASPSGRSFSANLRSHIYLRTDSASLTPQGVSSATTSLR